MIVANERREDSRRRNREMTVFPIMNGGPSGIMYHERLTVQMGDGIKEAQSSLLSFAYYVRRSKHGRREWSDGVITLYFAWGDFARR